MAEGTRLKEMQSQITKLTESLEKSKAEKTANQERLERIEAMLEELAQKLITSSSSHHGGSNSFRDLGKQPFQLRNVKLEFPRFDGSFAMEWIFKAEQFFDYYNTPDSERLTIAAVHLD